MESSIKDTLIKVNQAQENMLINNFDNSFVTNDYNCDLLDGYQDINQKIELNTSNLSQKVTANLCSAFGKFEDKNDESVNLEKDYIKQKQDSEENYTDRNGFVIDFSKKNKGENIDLFSSNYISKDFQNINIDKKESNLVPITITNKKISVDFNDFDRNLQTAKIPGMKNNFNLENDFQMESDVGICTIKYKKEVLPDGIGIILTAFQMIVTEEKKLEEYKQEMVLCNDFKVRDIFAVLGKYPSESLDISDLERLLNKVGVRINDCESDQDDNVVSKIDLGRLVRNYGSQGIGKLKKLNYGDFIRMICPLQKEYQISVNYKQNGQAFEELKVQQDEFGEQQIDNLDDVSFQFYF